MDIEPIDNALCWEMLVGEAREVTRLFVVDRYVGVQIMYSQRTPWEIRDLGTAREASNWAVTYTRNLEEQGQVKITVPPGTVSIYESEFNGLVPGKTIPPSLRVRIRQRIRRVGG